MQKLEIVISGRVQGVGFRYFTKQKAELYQIHGYVKNLSTDKVIVLALGEGGNMEHFLQALKNGPSSSYVEKVTTSPVKHSKEYDEFKISY